MRSELTNDAAGMTWPGPVGSSSAQLEALAWRRGGWVCTQACRKEFVQAAAVTSCDRRVRTIPCPAFLQTRHSLHLQQELMH